MSGYQQITIVGNVGATPDLKYTPAGAALCNFSVAVNESWGSGDERREKTTWFKVTAWKSLAETVHEHLRKGAQVMVVGTVSVSPYTNREGNPAASLELSARDVRFLGRKSDADEDHQQEVAAPVADGGDIPF